MADRSISANVFSIFVKIRAHILTLFIQRKAKISDHGSHGDSKTWKMKMVMDKSWNMKNWPKLWDFVISHGNLRILPNLDVFATVKKLSIDVESQMQNGGERGSWKTKKLSWTSIVKSVGTLSDIHTSIYVQLFLDQRMKNSTIKQISNSVLKFPVYHLSDYTFSLRKLCELCVTGSYAKLT